MIKIVLVMMLALILLSGCSSNKKLLKKSNMISIGQTKQDVMKELGIPEDRQFTGNNEAWQYCAVNGDSDYYVMIFFYANRVNALKTYNKDNYFGGDCSMFKTINWQDKVDKSVEVRYR